MTYVYKLILTSGREVKVTCDAPDMARDVFSKITLCDRARHDGIVAPGEYVVHARKVA